MGEKWTSLISSLNTDLSGQYWGGIKQETSHMIALNNWANGKTTIEIENEKLLPYNKNNDIRFINLVFEPNIKYVKEHKAFEKYKDRYEKLHKLLKDNELIPSGMKICFMSYSNLWRSSFNDDNGIPCELKQYLNNRYMKFANT